ncbi:trimethylamine methyltransferase [Deltaproteobacteria bacterium Smac51]|nr:trimethylamine methyltransferase [Deltaproteobacteria bacterium Smac51]
MIVDRMQSLSVSELDLIHQTTMTILEKNGLAFSDEETLDLFKKNGFKVSGGQVYFTEKDVLAALSTTPDKLTIKARNPEKSVTAGRDEFIFVPFYGPPFVVEADGRQRLGVMSDYEKAVKLVQTSRAADMGGFKYVEPSDLPTETAYLDMLLANITLSDKAALGSTDNPQAAEDTLEIMELVHGRDCMADNGVVVGLISPFSPLAFAADMSGSIISYARRRQPLIILNMVMAGISGPIQLPGLMAMANAEILGGVVLSQLAGPGTPVVYGTTSCPTNLKTGEPLTANPETLWISQAIMQLARYYNLPCRTGGSLTDSLLPDAQALAEGAMSLMNAVRGGANFIMHSLGMMGSFIGISFEKWIMDEELCGWMRAMVQKRPIVPETLSLESILAVGSNGSFLPLRETAKLCRKAAYENMIFNKTAAVPQKNEGAEDLAARAKSALDRRMAEYVKPDIDPGLEKDLRRLISELKEKRGRN